MNIIKTAMLIMTFLYLSASLLKASPDIGIKAGINISNSSGGFASNPDYKNGFTGGLFFSSLISNQIFLQPELLFSMKGYKFKNSPLDGKVSFQYIEFPLLIKAQILRKSFKNIHLYLGPVCSYNISARYETTVYGSTLTGHVENVNDFDYGVIFGCNIGIINKIFIDLRYNLSFNDWDSINKGYKHRVIAILLNYTL